MIFPCVIIQIGSGSGLLTKGNTYDYFRIKMDNDFFHKMGDCWFTVALSILPSRRYLKGDLKYQLTWVPYRATFFAGPYKRLIFGWKEQTADFATKRPTSQFRLKASRFNADSKQF